MGLFTIINILISSFCTSLGAMAVLMIKDVSHKGKDILWPILRELWSQHQHMD